MVGEIRERVDIVKFIETYCQDEYGRPVRLEFWQILCWFRPVFHTYRVAEKDNDVRGVKQGDLLRKFTRGIYSTPKKNGKSDVDKWALEFGLLADDPNPLCFSIAGDKDQAHIVGDRAKKDFQNIEAFKRQAEVQRSSIIRRDGKGVYRIVAAEAETLHGENASLSGVDEAWQYRDYSQLEALTNSPTRAEPLQVIYSYVPVQERPGAPLSDFVTGCLGSEDLVVLLDEGGQWNPVIQEWAQELLEGPGREYKCAGELEQIAKGEFPEATKYAGYERGDRVWCCAPREMPGLYVFLSEVNLARWIDQPYLDAQRGSMPPPLYRRLHKNKMHDETGGFVSREQVEACMKAYEEEWQSGKEAKGQSQESEEQSSQPGATVAQHSQPGAAVAQRVLGGVYGQTCDFGYRRDRTCIVVGCKTSRGVTVLEKMTIFQAMPGEEVQVVDVEREMRENCRRYPIRCTWIDEAQMIGTIQRMASDGLKVQGRHFSVAYNHAIALALYDGIVKVEILWPRRMGAFTHPKHGYSDFAYELPRLIVVEVGKAITLKDHKDTHIRWKIDHESTEFNDRSIAVGMLRVELAGIPIMRPRVRVV